MPIVTRQATLIVSSTGTWQNINDAVDTTDSGLFANWTNAARSTTANLVLGGFGFDTLIPGTATINSVTIRPKQYVSAGTLASATLNWTGGTAVALAQSASVFNEPSIDAGASGIANVRSKSFTTTLAGTRPNATTSSTWAVDYVEVDVDYTPFIPPDGPFDPRHLPGLITWLKADDLTASVANGAQVTNWVESTGGGGRTFTQATASKRPTLLHSQVNGKPLVRFDSTTADEMTAASSIPGSQIESSIFVAARLPPRKLNNIQNMYQAQWGLWAHSDINAHLGTYNANAQTFATTAAMVPAQDSTTVHRMSLHTGANAGANTLLFGLNGAEEARAVASLGAETKTTMSISGNTQYAEMDLAEVIHYSRALSSAERAQIDTYLSERWAAPTTVSFAAFGIPI